MSAIEFGAQGYSHVMTIKHHHTQPTPRVHAASDEQVGGGIGMPVIGASHHHGHAHAVEFEARDRSGHEHKVEFTAHNGE